MGKIVFIDLEVNKDGRVVDFGAIDLYKNQIHTKSSKEFHEFVNKYDFVCGHNIINHDLKYIEVTSKVIDTLYLSPLIFPKKPYHALIKDDKLSKDHLNNPLNDAITAMNLFFDLVSAFENLDQRLKIIYYALLQKNSIFTYFFEYKNYQYHETAIYDIKSTVDEYFSDKICSSVQILNILNENPVELAYAFAIITVIDTSSITPPWVVKNFPDITYILRILRGKPCHDCLYCNENLSSVTSLKKFFGYNNFRKYDGTPLQEQAVTAAISGESIMAVFPTGGGKSITFQVPALLSYNAEKSLTVVISPLQSLMKDQTDNLEQKHNITTAVSINSSLNPIERKFAIENIYQGNCSILYISPESLRSSTIEQLLLGRNIARFVIDEAHCFSAWGQDFRVDYLYIGEFIKNLQKKKKLKKAIPVSCFTATAKQEVMQDIIKYFQDYLDIELKTFRADSKRSNLSYDMIPARDDTKYTKLIEILEKNPETPTVIYASRIKKTSDIADFLNERGFTAISYHGKMEKDERKDNQEKFMNGTVNIIVATTAFGMGVDKDNVGLVIHWDISNSIESYVQEAGRAGRNQNIKANCYVLYHNDDLDKHFMLLNQTRIDKKEINQIWIALKDFTRKNPKTNKSALELARGAGWDESVSDIETRVRTSISALEQSGHVKRGQNMPRVYANSILVKSMIEASQAIELTNKLSKEDKAKASFLMQRLFSAKSKSRSNTEAESRIDYIADIEGIPLKDCIRLITTLREIGLIKNDQDMMGSFKNSQKQTKSILEHYKNIELFLINFVTANQVVYNVKLLQKEFNEQHRIQATKEQINQIINYFSYKRFYEIKNHSKDEREIVAILDNHELEKIINIRYTLLNWMISYLYTLPLEGESKRISFSVIDLKNTHNMDNQVKVDVVTIEDALYYIDKMQLMTLEGGFLVIYQQMQIKRTKSNAYSYNADDYKNLNRFYEQKTQAVHIVGKYATLLQEDQAKAAEFLSDYFEIEYSSFLRKYFRGQTEDIKINMTPDKYKKIFGALSKEQSNIINDKESQYIVVLAGPGSGKTRVLSHKLAALLQLEHVKSEQLLMLTFSRVAATEFKERLISLVGNAAHFVTITTFHSFCYDIMGRMGNSENVGNIVKEATELINNGTIEQSQITKTVLVIDEAQDMSLDEYNLMQALIKRNEEMKIIAVGDDDQNIYEFRNSDSKYFTSLLKNENAKEYNLLTNYRSTMSIVDFANDFTSKIPGRHKINPIISKSIEKGNVSLTILSSENIEVPVVKDFLEKYNELSGTSCIIVRSNKEVLNIIGMLNKQGIKATPIGTNIGFSLYNIDEIRTFISYYDTDKNLTISESKWEYAKIKLKETNSKNLFLAENIITSFENVYKKGQSKIRYKIDFVQFVRESKLEDFFDQKDKNVFVSTIHQTKGKEFDNVWLGIKNKPMDNESIRCIYVAITRSKNNLYVFCNGDYFKDTDDLEKKVDQTLYKKPNILGFELGLKDVYLDYFSKRQSCIIQCVSGTRLNQKDNYLFMNDKPIAKFSSNFIKEISKLQNEGYKITNAAVRHVVYWYSEKEQKEIKIILPWLQMKRQ